MKYIVLHEGNIIERGNHSDLIKLNGHYKQLIDLQKIFNIRNCYKDIFLRVTLLFFHIVKILTPQNESYLMK